MATEYRTRRLNEIGGVFFRGCESFGLLNPVLRLHFGYTGRNSLIVSMERVKGIEPSSLSTSGPHINLQWFSMLPGPESARSGDDA
jgi:hypothetical protein